MVNYQKKYKVKIKWKLVQSAESKDEKEREIYILKLHFEHFTTSMLFILVVGYM